MMMAVRARQLQHSRTTMNHLHIDD